MEASKDTMATARNIVNQLFDESGADVDTRQRINDACDEFTARLITDRVVTALDEVLADISAQREKAWKHYMQAPGVGEIESLRQGKFEGLDRACKRIQREIKDLRDG